MKIYKEMLADKRGVTPVIGVMLMIVVTVILAAAVSSYAGSMESQDVASQTSFSAEASQTDGHIRLNHLGGDTLYKSNMKIEIGSGTPSVTGYVNMSNVTFSPKSDYLGPGDLATIKFEDNLGYRQDEDGDWVQDVPIADFNGDEIDIALYVGTPFRLTVIDTTSGQTVYSTQLVMNP